MLNIPVAMQKQNKIDNGWYQTVCKYQEIESGQEKRIQHSFFFYTRINALHHQNTNGLCSQEGLARAEQCTMTQQF